MAKGKTNSSEESLDTLASYLAYWQKQLRLDNYDIKIRWMAEEEDRGDSNGLCVCYPGSHCAFIAITPESHFRPAVKNMFNCDYEVILVHELLHVRDNLWRDSIEVPMDKTVDDLYEIALDATAEALVRARRGLTR